MKRNRLLVFETIGEACRLWAANVQLVCLIALTISIPKVIQIIIPQIAGNTWLAQVLQNAILGVVLFILDAAKSAVLFTALVNGGQFTKKMVYDAIHRFGAKLVGVHLLIGVVAGIVIALVSFGVAEFDLFEAPSVVAFLSIAMAIIWIIFLKYALTDPLVVIENCGVFEALRQSWRMTRSHLSYVAATYITVGVLSAFIGLALQHLVVKGWVGVLTNEVFLFVQESLEMVWVTLAWCLYHRIKEADTPLVEDGSATELPPEQPPTLRSA